MRELTVDAVVESLDAVTDFVDEGLEELDCPMKVMMQINVAVDELFSNIARYAYSDGAGKATVQIDALQDSREAVITFIDQGIPYDPLKKEDPDVTLSANEREVGGLGIFLVKKIMDDMKYEYKDGQNILKIFKKL